MRLVAWCATATLCFALIGLMTLGAGQSVDFLVVPFSLCVWLALILFFGGVVMRGLQRRSVLRLMNSTDQRRQTKKFQAKMLKMLRSERWYDRPSQFVIFAWLHIDKNGNDPDVPN